MFWVTSSSSHFGGAMWPDVAIVAVWCASYTTRRRWSPLGHSGSQPRWPSSSLDNNWTSMCVCVKDEVCATNSAVWMDFMNMCWTMDMVIMDMKFTDGWLSVSQDASAPNVLDIYPQWSCWVGEAWQAVAGSECVADILLSSMVNRSSKCQKIHKWHSLNEIFRTCRIYVLV